MQCTDFVNGADKDLEYVCMEKATDDEKKTDRPVHVEREKVELEKEAGLSSRGTI